MSEWPKWVTGQGCSAIAPVPWLRLVWPGADFPAGAGHGQSTGPFGTGDAAVTSTTTSTQYLEPYRYSNMYGILKTVIDICKQKIDKKILLASKSPVLQPLASHH